MEEMDGNKIGRGHTTKSHTDKCINNKPTNNKSTGKQISKCAARIQMTSVHNESERKLNSKNALIP